MLLTADTIVTGSGSCYGPGGSRSRGTPWSRWVRHRQPSGRPRPRPATVVPGFVDTHVHGGGGGAFSSAAGAETAAAVDFHLRHGTTTLVASLVTAAPADLIRQLENLTDEVRAGRITGIHLEGPWLAAARCGAHEPSLLRDPDPGEVDAVLAAGAGHIRMVTVAPGGPAPWTRSSGSWRRARWRRWAHRRELRADPPGDRGRRPGGHSPVQRDAPDPSPRAGSGDRAAGGPSGDGRTDRRRRARRRRAVPLRQPQRRSRPVVVGDRCDGRGRPADGAYRIGPLAVDVVDGVARLAGTQTIAGSTATMDRVFRFAVAHSHLPQEEALLLAVRRSSVNPARALGLPSPVLAAARAPTWWCWTPIWSSPASCAPGNGRSGPAGEVSGT